VIEKTIHFIFLNLGLSSNCGEKPFTLVHLLAIKSAKMVNNCEVVLHYENEINNVWWEESKHYCTHQKCKSPKEFCGHRLDHIAYVSDIMRLQILSEMGGIYLDIDTISIKPLEPFLFRKFTMGKEVVKGEVLGLCSAVLIGEKKSKFIDLWLREYKERYDPRWGYMSARRPYQLALKNPTLITV